MIVFHVAGAVIMFCVHHPLGALLLAAAGLGGLAWLCRRHPPAPPAPPPVVVRTGGGALAVAGLLAAIVAVAAARHPTAAPAAAPPPPSPSPAVTVTEHVTHITQAATSASAAWAGVAHAAVIAGCVIACLTLATGAGIWHRFHSSTH